MLFVVVVLYFIANVSINGHGKQLAFVSFPYFFCWTESSITKEMCIYKNKQKKVAAGVVHMNDT